MARLHTEGQHFLRSPRLVAELVGHSNVRKNDLVYDLGAGSGVIASVLARRARAVVAVESDQGTFRKLQRHLGDVKNVTLVNHDILTLPLPGEPYKIFANIPFHLSAKIVRYYLLSERPPKTCYLIVQRQFARKLVESDRHFNSELGASLWPWYTLRIRKPLRKTDFTPPPAVDTVLLEIKPRENPLLESIRQEDYLAFVERCFSRQAYYRSLPLDEAGISAERKPSELTSDQWVKLFGICYTTGSKRE